VRKEEEQEESGRDNNRGKSFHRDSEKVRGQLIASLAVGDCSTQATVYIIPARVLVNSLR